MYTQSNSNNYRQIQQNGTHDTVIITQSGTCKWTPNSEIDFAEIIQNGARTVEVLRDKYLEKYSFLPADKLTREKFRNALSRTHHHQPLKQLIQLYFSSYKS